MSFFKQIQSIFGKEAEPEVTPQPASRVESVVDAAPAEPVERRNKKRVNSHKGRRVLIIDDSTTIIAALKKMLRSAGCITMEALDAETGLEIVRQVKPDLVFLDIVLPGMNGFAALRLMRRDPLTQHIPVIMISGNEQATEQFYAKRIGADDFMKKPFSRFEVFARMDSLIVNNKLVRRKMSAEEEKPLAAAVPSSVPPQAPASEALRPPEAVQAPKLPVQPAVSPVPMSPLEARKQLTAMGLQYFSQEEFVAAIQRWDHMALEFFIVGGGVNINLAVGDKTLIEYAQSRGQTNIVALLCERSAAVLLREKSETSALV